ncbi:MAG: NAD(+) synthase [Acidobacteriota bacterium]|nr:NAD(+) synthase [Acidobacteriota bacterium]
MTSLSEPLTNWVRRHVDGTSADGLVVGLSGGIDSATVARLCQLALPDAVVGVLLPCHSDPQDAADARLVADHFDLPTITISLDAVYDTLTSELRASLGKLPQAPDDLESRLPLANVKPRLRMTSLYFVANAMNYLVAGTGNRSEMAIGYYTKYGDGGVDLLPIGNLLKDEVRDLAQELGVPTPIIEKPPSAGLWVGQKDETEMGFTYAELAAYLQDGPEAVSPESAKRIEQLTDASAHKRTLPPRPPLTTD